MPLIILALVCLFAAAVLIRAAAGIYRKTGPGFTLKMISAFAVTALAPPVSLCFIYYACVKSGNTVFYAAALWLFIAAEAVLYGAARIISGRQTGGIRAGIRWSVLGKGAAGFFLLLLPLLVVLPKSLMLVQLGSEGKVYSRLFLMRQKLEEYRQRNGKYPEDIREAAELPKIEIWGTDPVSYRLHYHGQNKSLRIIHEDISFSEEDGVDYNPAGIEDSGGWVYNPETGQLRIDCRGCSKKMHRNFYRY